MTLYLQIGSYLTPTCTVRCTGRSIQPIEYNSFIVAHEHTLGFEGYLYADGPAALSSLMANLDAAIRVPNPTIGLISTITGATAHTISGSGSIGGVVLKSFQYVDTPLHMATQVKYQLSAAVVYGNTALTRNVVSVVETIRIQGDGGPDIVLAPQSGLKSIPQKVAEYTDVLITQSGKIVSRSSFVPVPSPVITSPDARVSRQSGLTKSYKQKGTSIWLYEQDYSYTFQLNELPETPIVPSYLT